MNPTKKSRLDFGADYPFDRADVDPGHSMTESSVADVTEAMNSELRELLATRNVTWYPSSNTAMAEPGVNYHDVEPGVLKDEIWDRWDHGEYDDLIEWQEDSDE